jgi:hypothetical protein
MSRRPGSPEPPEIRSKLPRGELIVSFKQRISELHEKGKQADEAVRQALINKIELTRQCGQTIASARADLQEREFASATDFLSNESIQAYLKLARSNPEPVTDLEDAIRAIHAAMQTSGAIEFPSGHGPQTLHVASFFQKASGWIMAFTAGYKKFVRGNPVRNWDTDAAEQFIYSLKPILEIHREIQLHVHRQREAGTART